MKLTYALLPATMWSLAHAGIWPLDNYDYKWHVKNWQAGLTHSGPTVPQSGWYGTSPRDESRDSSAAVQF